MSFLLLLLSPAHAAHDARAPQLLYGGSSFGTSLAHGDLNGDGFQDVIVGEPEGDRVEVFYGQQQGMVISPHHLPSPDSSVDFGAVLASGDWNGDGRADLVVAGDQGLYLYYGVSDKLDPVPDRLLPDTTLLALASLDMNDDGYADLAVISQSGESTSLSLLYGSKDGLDELSPIEMPGEALERFGVTLAGVGDLDGDGYPDLAVSSQSESLAGQVHIFYGGASIPEGGAAIELPSGMDEQGFGLLLAGAGDLDGDGYDELLVGDGGSVALLLGSSAGPRQGPAIELPSADVDLIQAVAGVGDVNVDGYPDFVVGTPESGAVTLVFGGEQQPFEQQRIGDLGLSSPGLSVSAAGDVNGDGVSDYLVAGQSSLALVFGGCVDEDQDGVCQESDCDDQDAEVQLAESVWYVDQDQDGYTLEESTTACEAPVGYSEQSDELDCDDEDAQVYPDAEELPDDGVDQDCDGQDISSSGAALMAGETGGVAGCSSSPERDAPWWIALMAVVALVLRRYSPKSSR